VKKRTRNSDHPVDVTALKDGDADIEIRFSDEKELMVGVHHRLLERTHVGSGAPRRQITGKRLSRHTIQRSIVYEGVPISLPATSSRKMSKPLQCVSSDSIRTDSKRRL